MWKRVPVEEWHLFVALGVFALTFGVFLFIFIRALRMSEDKKKELENLPFNHE